jgi:hypothetical protein
MAAQPFGDAERGPTGQQCRHLDLGVEDGSLDIQSSERGEQFPYASSLRVRLDG